VSPDRYISWEPSRKFSDINAALRLISNKTAASMFYGTLSDYKPTLRICARCFHDQLLIEIARDAE